MHIDEAVADWGDKLLLYHLKARPARFLRAMYVMSVEREAAGMRLGRFLDGSESDFRAR